MLESALARLVVDQGGPAAAEFLAAMVYQHAPVAVPRVDMAYPTGPVPL